MFADQHFQSIFRAAGADLVDIVKATVFLSDIREMSAFNEAYMEFFGTAPPARSCFAVASLPVQGALVEIESIAEVDKLPAHL
jgi:2-iminobutanoate/2-iminopropanoate deaminase